VTTTPRDTTTIGVAIAVPDPWGAQLQEYRAALGDVRAGGIPTHVTLLPPNRVDRADQPVIEKHLADASAATDPFSIHLRGTGTFRPVSPVVFVTLAEGISSCERLAAAVQGGPLEADREFPYHPHVTVAHHLPDESLDRAFEEMADFECDFVVDRFALYVHDVQAGWVPTREFSLGAGSEAQDALWP
jgi:2'-5' RNA ligase